MSRNSGPGNGAAFGDLGAWFRSHFAQGIDESGSLGINKPHRGSEYVPPLSPSARKAALQRLANAGHRRKKSPGHSSHPGTARDQ